MNYENAKAKRDVLLKLQGTKLIKSSEWTINHILILPQHDGHLLMYTGHVSMYNPNWMATGFNHDFIYKQSGIYLLYDGRQMDDNLTLYATIFNKKNNLEVDYKCELLYNLAIRGEIWIEDSPDSFLRHP